ncbi:MAG: ABC transporter ATP-binding protein [Herpetosiphonaceae bacterium]|nr:ABC transporter ATP-binding protein [Herpetosiphonaceae bacterium]
MMRGIQAAAQLEETGASQSGPVLRRLMGYLQPFWKELLVVLGLVLLGAFTQAAGPYLIGRAIDGAIAKSDRAGLNRTMVLLLVVYLAGWVASRFQLILMGTIGQRTLARLRIDIFATLQRLSLRFFDQQPAGDLMSRLVNDTDVLNQLLSQGLAQVLGSLFGLVGIVIAMLALEPRLALTSFVVIPVMLVATRVFSNMSRRAFRDTREAIGDVSAELQEEIAGVKVAQAFNRTGVNQVRFAQRNAANRDANVRATMVTSAFPPVIDVLSTAATAIVAGYGGYLAIHNLVTVGVVVAFLTYVQQFFRPIQQLSTFYTTAQASLAAAERIFDLVDTAPDIIDPVDAQLLPPVEGRVVFDHVSFNYGRRAAANIPSSTTASSASTLVLDDISLDAQPGQTIAIVGPTGAGKTTLVNLIGRFYDVVDGAVRIDGWDVRDVTRASLRSQMGIVLQDSFLFAGTIIENIRYGRLDATDAEVEAAARAANAHDFIMRMPHTYKTRLGEGGRTLSQGQRQLLGIARAILANPRILILDEATSSVDTRTELLIQSALRTLLKSRTSFVIAHRLSTIRAADQVLVLRAGRIVERGTHQELLTRGGMYAELYRRQFRDEEPFELVRTA